MRTISFALILLFAGSLAFAQFGENPPLPPDELALRTRLESDKSVIKLTCGLMMPIGPKEMYAKEASVQQSENTRLRRKFLKAVQKLDSLTIAYTCGTDEGGTISRYLISEKGKLTFVDDYSRDPFGGLRLTKYDCSELRMGHYLTREGKGIVFEEFDEPESGGRVIFLTCTSTNPGRRKIVF